MKRIELIIILTLIVIISGGLYWWNRDNHIEGGYVGETTLSPTQVKSIEAIGQWEFISVNDEELVDTTRQGFFGDDQLVRIYYGTLRLGIDTKDLQEGWLKADQDTIICTLPTIKLLDNNFIDEAKTKSFYENGKWTGKDRQEMYYRAYNNMKKRCLSATNISSAESNAIKQFYNMFKAMGFSNVKIRFEESES